MPHWLGFKVRVGAMIADLYNATAEQGGDVNALHEGLTVMMLMLAAAMHVDEDHAPAADKSDEAFLNIARSALAWARTDEE